MACTTDKDVFPGARLGERTGPQGEIARLTAAQAEAAAEVAPARVFCDGDGVSGKRVEVLYVREPSMPDRYSRLLPMFQAWLSNADDSFNDAAAAGGKSRHIRYVTEAVSGGCQIAVREVVVPAESLATFNSGTAAVQALGYNRADRKYLMLTEATVVCGVGQRYVDDRPGAENYNNLRAYARVDAVPNCFGANAIAHELGHTFGAVQESAPHFQTSHCSDQFDLMCYGGTPSWSCLKWDDYRLPDCNRDDYFNVSPAAGSYLATHWNTADSEFLVKGDTSDVVPHPTVGLTYVITSVSTGGAIEPIGGSATGLVKLSQRARTNTLSQSWLMGYKTGLQFVNMNSRMCADSAYSGTASGTQTLQYNCKGTDGMRWAYLPQADGSYAIVNWLSGLALTVTGAYPAPLEQRPYTGATNQRWKFNRLINSVGPGNGASYYLTGVGNRENVEVLNGALTSGASVTHKPHSGAKNQQWVLRNPSSATSPDWQLVNANSGKCLDLKTTSTAAGTQVVQTTCSTTSSRQKWQLQRVADRTYVIVNKYSKRALNMTTGSLSVLTQQVLAGDNSNHFWALKQV
ncbi:RICIN domain-containing protein [Streptosporangium roseum]|uniref:RICIN domain-containing protein n=1 Tax=Streptosporangium roseum TaxID=2001 RepID=UPI00331EC531